MVPKIKCEKFIFLVLLFVVPSQVIAQFEYYSLEEGLSQANVRSILQDRNGFLWFGTQDGLNRFDGYQFTKFRSEPNNPNSLPGNYISCLTEDKDGNIMIGTVNGATIYNPLLNKFNKVTIRDSIYNLNDIGSVSSILCAKDGSVWIGDYYSGVIRIHEGKAFRFMKNSSSGNSISDNYTTALCEDRDGNIWIGTFSSGLNKYNITTGKFEYISISTEGKKGLSSNFITSLCPDNNGNIFVGTTDGLNIINSSTNEITIYKTHPSVKNSISGNNIISIYCDKKDKIWLALEGKGVNIYDASRGTFAKISIESKANPGSEEKNIWAIYEDSFGNYWFGTSTEGVIKWKKNRSNFSSYTKKLNNNFLSNYSVRSIFVDSENSTWVGTDNGLNKIQAISGVIKKYFYNHANQSTINDNKIWSITEDKKGNIWLGTQRGLALYDKRNDTFKRILYNTGTSESLPVFAIRCIYVDTNNIVWFGTFGAGLFSYNIQNKKFQNYTLTNNNPDAKKDVVIFQIEEDHDGNLWLITSSGLAKYNKITGEYQRFFSDSKEDYTGFQCVLYSLYRENDSTLWIGTLGNGLIKFNPVQKKYRNYTEKDGLPNNVVYGILADKKNNLWLSTNYGISKFSIKSDQFKNYDKNDGVPTDEFNTGAFASGKNGYLYFGGIEGLLYFNPDSVYSSTVLPNLAVTNFKVFDKVVAQNKTYLDGEEINLDYRDNFFSFEFVSLDLTSPTNEYAYMLEGYDREWIHSGKRRYAAYTDVDPGHYSLRVKATNSDGIWNEKGISLAINISPPFWTTLWFRFLAVSFFSGVIILLYNRRIRRFKIEAEKQILFSRQLISAQESERSRLAAELHDGVGQNLLIVSNLTQMGLKKPEIAQKNLDTISEVIKESIKDIRQISRDLHPYHIEELGITIALQSMISRIKESTEIVFNDFIENVDRFLSLDASINIFRIVQEAINNIIKHSKAKNVVISLSAVDDNIQLVIKDDGIGIDELSDEQKHVGLGLRTMKERAIALNGRFTIECNKETGTIIKVLIPK